MHLPVLQKEVVYYLDPKPNENFVDCTIGSGGHSLAILEKTSPNGKILGIDRDKEIINLFKKYIDKKFQKRLILVADNFANLKNIVAKTKFNRVKGILFDLGLSSWHIEKSGRGFSFLRNEPLIMRYDATQDSKEKLSAAKIVNYWPREKIEKILKEYGQEKFARKISEKIVEERKIRPITTTFRLVEIIKSATPRQYHKAKIHPATRTFMALRIAVNDELTSLRLALPQALEILEPGGKIAVISFHSLEDKIVKEFFKTKQKLKEIDILTPKPVVPSFEERINNPRSRSAKLRVAVKI